ncbi:hypothetical protein EBI_27216 [Enterocytozoon bieneusi H348]|nr:hypothetical protein EBI_27216 [Enterocytozoon bieneusi H348]|eukprot:XP_002651379.1 hypothetical protein EBI_27216 [Enterocytozoon bieneusi H348]
MNAFKCASTLYSWYPYADVYAHSISLGSVHPQCE